jgi:hypothetical protein
VEGAETGKERGGGGVGVNIPGQEEEEGLLCSLLSSSSRGWFFLLVLGLYGLIFWVFKGFWYAILTKKK